MQAGECIHAGALSGYRTCQHDRIILDRKGNVSSINSVIRAQRFGLPGVALLQTFTQHNQSGLGANGLAQFLGE